MKLLVYLMALAYLFLPTSGFARVSQEARYAQIMGAASSAEKLEALAEARREFPNGWPLAEGAAIFYVERNWPALFGLAYYVRHYTPPGEAKARVGLLEVLASLRHCRWNDARDLLRAARSEVGSTIWRDDHRALSELLDLATQGSVVDKVSSPTADGQCRLWPLPAGVELTKINPLKLRRAVRSECPTAEEKEKEREQEQGAADVPVQ